MCEKVVESVFWPRWQVCTQGPGKRLKISPLPSTKLQWMLLWITAGCLFVCLFFTNKQELLAPTFPHLSPTCSHCNSSSHLSINKASSLPQPLSCQLSHMGTVVEKDFPVGVVFRTWQQDSLFYLSIAGVDSWISWHVSHINCFQERLTSLPAFILDQLTCQASSIIQSNNPRDRTNTSPMELSWTGSGGACSGGSGGSTVLNSHNTPFTQFLQLYLLAEDRWSWASTCRSVFHLFEDKTNPFFPSGSPAADAGAAVAIWAGAWRGAQVPVTQPIGGPSGCCCCC